MTARRTSALDRPPARFAALGIAVLAALALGYIHRDDLFSSGTVEASGSDPVVLCLAERSADIDRMVAEGIVDDARAAIFKSRAEAMCQATVGGGNAAPPPPGQ